MNRDLLAVVTRNWDRATFALVMTIYITEIHDRDQDRLSRR